MTAQLLVVAGEASGDRIASQVLRAASSWDVDAWGVGGPMSRAQGLETLADSDSIAAMGPVDAVRRAPAIARAIAAVVRRVEQQKPRAALLVNFTELNLHLGRALRAMGIRVLWCAAPQVWAWRAYRVRAMQCA